MNDFLGGDEIDGEDLLHSCRRALSIAGIAATLTLKEDLRVPISLLEQRKSKLGRIGINPSDFHDPGLLALAAIKEGKKDELCHWVVLIGPEWLGRASEEGLVLDSQRGYEAWSLQREYSQIHIERGPGCKKPEPDCWWVFSFIDVAIH